MTQRILALPRGVVIVHGNQRGADKQAARVAELAHIPTDPYPAEWWRGKDAGTRRNKAMLRDGASLVIAFTRPEAVGSNHMLDWAGVNGVEWEEHRSDGRGTITLHQSGALNPAL